MFNQDLVLNVSELRKVFNGRAPFTAVDGVSFAVKTGEIIGLLGPNGAGKSTTIQMLIGALKPTSGRIEYFGRELHSDRSAILSQVAFLNGYGNLPWNLTVYENLQTYGRLYGLGAKERIKRISSLLEYFRVPDKKHKLMHTLSAGEKTRVMLARAFLAEPLVVLLDEPTAALDPAICRDVLDFILKERRERGIAVLYTSHNMSEVAEICDQVIFLKRGKILAVDTPQALAAKTALTKLRLRMESVAAGADFFCRRLKAGTVQHDNNWLELSVAEETIGKLLLDLSEEGLSFSKIEIEKPTLDDFFIAAAKGG